MTDRGPNDVVVDRFGNARFGGEVRRLADVPLGEARWLWKLWTGFPAGASGVAADRTNALCALIHALDPDEGAGFRDQRG
jgi:hypothetical protein